MCSVLMNYEALWSWFFSVQFIDKNLGFALLTVDTEHIIEISAWSSDFTVIDIFNGKASKKWALLV